ncbi:MAG: alpha/beta fold hydrolase [Elainellaceae cyanobacterium]
MPHIDIRGVPHFYRWVTAAGQTADDTAAENPSEDAISQHRPTKPVMVFIHGWGGSLRYWLSTAQSLTDRFDCLLYDLRGFGQSRLPRPLSPDVAALGYELEGYADDLALLLDHLGLERIYLNAHSTGASVAVLFLNRYGDRVHRAVLTCSGIFEYVPWAFKLFHQASRGVVALRPAWLSRLPGVDRLFMTRFLYRPIPKLERIAFLEDYLLADGEAAMGTVYTAVSQQAAEVMPKEFAALQVPTLLVSGEHDQIIPAQLGTNAAALNPRIEQVTISDTAHFPMLEDPEVYRRHLASFLSPVRLQNELS